MSNFYIQKHAEAEKDDYLIECFHDAGFIDLLTRSRFSIISGRKGAGKTAIARYLEQKKENYGIDYAYRLSIRNISIDEQASSSDRINSILFFILVKTVQKLLENNFFPEQSQQYWKDFLSSNGLQQVSDYETFVESQKTNKTGFSIKAWLSYIFAKAEGSIKTEDESQLSRAIISKSPSALIEALTQSLPKNKSVFIFIDDIGDHLDNMNPENLKKNVAIIRDVLLQIDTYNTSIIDREKNLRFISLLRDDLFDFMEGSNINKLRQGSLELEWDEKSFASLLIRRLPFYSNDLEDSLHNPIEAIKKGFPDEIFAEILSNFDINRRNTNFYAYMVAISFNRPRDFLKFCYAMRDRLSLKHLATRENIESAEIEYSDYFRNELRDELFLAARIIGYELNVDNLNILIDMLDKKNGFNSSELRTELGKYLGEKTSLGKKKIELFIQELYRYGILGFKESQDGIINFKYISKNIPLILESIKKYIFFLHRGLWWFAQKRKIRIARPLNSFKKNIDKTSEIEIINVKE